jgi:PBSX family phage portal protein
MKKKDLVKVSKLGIKLSADSLFGKAVYGNDQFGDSSANNDEIAVPVYNYENLRHVPEINDIVDTNIRAIVQNVTGFGYHFEQISGDQKEYERQLAIVKPLFDDPNEYYETFVTIIKLVSIDRETYGTGYLEVRRNNEGNIARLYHMPAYRIRARKDRIDKKTKNVEQRGYVLLSSDDKPIMYFKNFGDARDLNSETGEYGKVPFNMRASELIEFKHHNTQSKYYGIPQYISAESAIIGNNYASAINNNRFKNNCVPDQLIVVNNGSIISGKEELSEYFRREFKGAENAGKSLLIEIEGYDKSLVSEGLEKATVQVIPLNDWHDADFLEFQANNDIRIRRVFRLSKIIIGETDDVNRASARTAKEIAEEQVFSPIRIEMNEIINQTIIKDILQRHNILDSPAVWFAFDKMTMQDPDYELRKAEVMASTRVASINEIRNLLGLPSYGKEGDKIYNTPIIGISYESIADVLNQTNEEVKSMYLDKLQDILGKNENAEAYKMLLKAFNVID